MVGMVQGVMKAVQILYIPAHEVAEVAVLLTELLVMVEMDMSRLSGKEDYNETLCNDFVK